jgi:DNA replication and repair protein RecF
LKEQIRDAHWYRAIELQMARTGIEIHSARMHALDLIQNAQDTASTEFPVAQLTMEQSGGDMPNSVDDLKSALEESRFRDMAAGRTLVGPHRTDMIGVFQRKGVHAKDCSTGEQKALLISMILANAHALKEQIGTAPLVLLDEVSAHLDNQRRAALYQEVCDLGAQAWMTGTEIDVFQELGDRAQAIHVTDADGLSDCTQYETCLV